MLLLDKTLRERGGGKKGGCANWILDAASRKL